MRVPLKGFDIHLETSGLDTISEIFDGDHPYCPGGCTAQAWSVVEILERMWKMCFGSSP
jgi:glycogen debranching enzyme